MKKMYETPGVETIEIELTCLLIYSPQGEGNVFDEDYENIGDKGDPGDVAE